MRTLRAEFGMQVPSVTDFQLLVLPASQYAATETLACTLDGAPIACTEYRGIHGTRELHATVPAGTFEVRFEARVDGAADATPDGDPDRYTGPSRYIEVEALHAFASERFGRAEGWEAVDAIVRWVSRNLRYEPSLSNIDDSARTTLRSGGGMCRDYAHVTIGLARALGIPARYVSVYAPELSPPDFHAVAEVYLNGQWWLIDATHLAPRASMVRIATGLDAAETAWATNWGSTITLQRLSVSASDTSLAEGASDDVAARVQLA